MEINKPIYLVTADIYLRFPEIMEEEFEDLTEYLEDEHIVYEGATDVVYDLQKENFKLQARCDRLENNWNELKEWAKDGMKNSLHIPYECDLDFEDVLEKMQEIKGGSDGNNN